MSPGHSPVRADNTLSSERSVFVQRQDRRDAPCRRCPAVTHDHLVIAFCTRGTATIEQQGTWSLAAGDVLLIPAGSAHRHLDAQDAELWGLGLCPICFRAEGGADLLEPLERVRSGAAAVVTIPEPRRARLLALYTELQREIDEAPSGTQAAQNSLVSLILTEVARAMASRVDAAPSSSVVTEALRYIERHCTESISLQHVAAAIHRSPAYVTTLVRRSTGRSVQAWIIAGRLAEARRRLRSTDEMIEVIAERVGYADATHFIRLFRRAHGVTPAAWRTGHHRAESARQPLKHLSAPRGDCHSPPTDSTPRR
jgi:AraC family transcriptional regulator, transcriptional activator of pobA